ncbi:MAG: hypothetical protein Ct9H300mP19_00900 [Dehalococcoidia bacterium]|nr:MAG: hypothetical protein Ct9H300mP19_00900 [Dehalococcoidia bacterium]
MAQPSTVSPSHLEQDTIAFQPRRHLLDVDDLSASEISNLLDTLKVCWKLRLEISVRHLHCVVRR